MYPPSQKIGKPNNFKGEFEDTKGLISILKSTKDRQHNGQKTTIYKTLLIKLNIEQHKHH